MEFINLTPFNPALIPGRYTYPGYSLTFIIKGTFDLKPGEAAIVSKDQLFPSGDEFYPEDEDMLGGPRYPSDFAYLKPRTDLLLVGKYFSPEGKKNPSGTVKFQVGTKSKSLNIYGNRYWTGSLSATFSNPEPFSEMELRYENSFGGKDYKRNPVGKGIDKVENKSGAKLIPLPNIMHPGETPSLSFKLEPAGFGPLGQMWIQRFSKLGSYKGNYVKERWPWFPKDFDWSYFNAAPADMQLNGYLKGDEKLYFENLHPVHSKYHSMLPGFRVRCFLNELDEKKEIRFKEVKTNLDSLWVDMESEKIVLVWRGVSDIKTEDYEEIQHILIVSEKLEEQFRSNEYYRKLLEKELVEPEEEEEKAYEPEIIEEDKSEDIELEKEIAKADKQMRDALIEAGIDPDTLPQQSEEDKKKEAEILKELGFEEEKEEVPINRENFILRANRKESFENEDLRGMDLSELNLQELNFQNAILTGVLLKNSNLSAANLTGVNLSEADLSSAKLNNAIMKDTDLTLAILIKADLTGAIIEGAVIEKAKLNNAILNEVRGKDALFSGADLTEASVIKSDLSGVDFSKCILDKANFNNSKLIEASFEGASGIQINLSETDLTGLKASGAGNFTKASFRKARGFESIWEKAILNEADFSFCEMEGANFSAASLEKANLTAANMKFAKFIKANLSNAIIKDMNLFQGSFEKANLTKADCSRSNFYGVEFLNSKIIETKFYSTNLKMTKLAG